MTKCNDTIFLHTEVLIPHVLILLSTQPFRLNPTLTFHNLTQYIPVLRIGQSEEQLLHRIELTIPIPDDAVVMI